MAYFGSTNLIMHIFRHSDKPTVFADSPTNRQTLLQAAEITYSKENDVITALGNVELSQGSRFFWLIR